MQQLCKKTPTPLEFPFYDPNLILFGFSGQQILRGGQMGNAAIVQKMIFHLLPYNFTFMTPTLEVHFYDPYFILFGFLGEQNLRVGQM